MYLDKLNEAMFSAVSTLREEPSSVPKAPDGWLAQAEEAKSRKDADRMRELLNEIVRAHAGMRADFDHKGWLYVCRNFLVNNPKPL